MAAESPSQSVRRSLRRRQEDLHEQCAHRLPAEGRESPQEGAGQPVLALRYNTRFQPRVKRPRQNYNPCFSAGFTNGNCLFIQVAGRDYLYLLVLHIIRLQMD